MIKAVIFDVDGTLIDSVDAHARAWQEIFRRLGYETPFEAVRRQIGKGGDELMPVFLPRELIAERGEAIEKERQEYFQETFLDSIQPFPGNRELFQRIQAEGKHLVLASSARKDELKRYEKIAGISDLVEEKTSSDDAERSKPNPDIFQAALRRLGDVRPDESIVVGDTPYDAEAAAKAGIPTIGLTCGGWSEAELRQAGCLAVYRDPADLLAHYEGSPLAG